MKTRNKKISLIALSVLLISPLLASADMNNNTWSMDNNNMPPPTVMWQWQMMMSGSSVTWSGWQTTSEDRTKIDYIMKSLEAQLKIIRESITKDNIDEMKQKALDLQATYKAKIAEAFPDRAADVQKIVDYRFTIFFNNQFKIREQVKEIKDNAMNSASGTINQAKEMAKKAIDNAKELKKTENTQVRNEIKQVKKDLKAQYKSRFLRELKNKLDNIPADRLQTIINNVEAKREIIANNTTIKDSTKEKYLAQIDALLEILNDKVSESNDNLDINQLIDSTSNTNSSTWTTNTGSTVSQ